MNRRLAGLVALVGLAVACHRTAAPATTTIAVIPKSTSQVYWLSVHAGAEKAARELGVSIIWRGPMREDDRDGQVSEVESFVTRGVAGIVLAPLDQTALEASVADAAHAGIPTVIIDSGLKGSDYVSFVATDNRKGGHLAGDRLVTLLHGTGKVVLLRYTEGSDSTNEREEGFLEALAAHPGIQLLSANEYGGADVEGAYKKSEAILERFKTADGRLGVDGIFCPNESTTLAMLRVLEDNGWAGKVRFIGFDASDTIDKGLTDGHIDGLVLQDPLKMGYLGVKTLVASLRGSPVDKRIDTGVTLVTHDTMDTPEAKALLYPDLSPWLKP